jgi:predicted dienelactone hydrolase
MGVRFANMVPFAAVLMVLLVLAARGQILGRRIEQRQEAKREAEAARNPPVPRPATACPAAAPSGGAESVEPGDGASRKSLNLGFHIQTFSNGLRAAVWYPTTSAESAFTYPGHFASAVARDAPVASCQTWPLIVYSHGFTGCGTVALFYTESQARAGYVVVAPDHKDSKCKVDEPFQLPLREMSEEPFQRPDVWDESTYRDRAADIRRVLDELPHERMFAGHIDRDRIGATGHSLGGYTIAGMTGGWASWRDSRIKAAVLMSPYVQPFEKKNTLDDIHVPVMYQGGTRDFGITPSIKKQGGAYDLTNAPKFFVEIQDAGHLDWSNFACNPYGAIPACASESMAAREIDRYAIAFFDRYLKGQSEPMLDEGNPGLADYRHEGGH